MSRTDAQNGLYASLTFHKLTTMASPILCTCHQNSSPWEIWGIRLLYILIRENSPVIGEVGGAIIASKCLHHSPPMPHVSLGWVGQGFPMTSTRPINVT
jgi:hypothetical protein